MTTHSFWRRIQFQASFKRALLEALTLNVALGLILAILPLSGSLRHQLLFYFIQPLGGVLFAFRLRRRTGGVIRQSFGEGADVVALGIVLSVVPLIYLSYVQTFGTTNNLVLDAMLEVGLDFVRTIISISAVRLMLRVWAFWDHLRRTKLVWALTHAHLLVVVIAAVCFAVALAIGPLSGIIENSTTSGGPIGMAFVFARTFVSALPVLGLMIVATVIALVIVVPPSALFSFLFARRTTRRLEELAKMTGEMRQGHYAARVVVQGEDEVACLQEDFNAMATELEQTLHALTVERDKVSGLLDARRQLVASVSHELRTPVATLRGYIESALSQTNTSPDDLQHDLQIMEQETLRLQKLIDDLFTLSRAEVGKLAMQAVPTDVRQTVTRCVNAQAPLAWQSGRVTVVAELPNDLPLVKADQLRLEQIIHNLLRNGVRHTPPGGIVAVSAFRDPAMLTLKVRDTGEGIAEEDLPHIWERFYRSDRACALDGAGAGLGLAIVKELTEAMGGTVGVESAPGAGSCFTVRLPYSPA
jgi:signal transduction histidine kinase